MKDTIHKTGLVGAFLAGAAATAAVGGYLFFGSKQSSRNRKKVDGWIEDAKDEVLKNAKKIKHITREKFDETVDTVTEKYGKLKDVAKEKIDDVREELSDLWEEVKEEVAEK